MRHCAGIVFRESGVEIVGDSGVEILFCSEALQDVDVFHEEFACAKAPARQPSPAF